MTQFEYGQDVEVSKLPVFGDQWRKATIIGMHGDRYLVRLEDGSTHDFEVNHIRPIEQNLS